MIKSFVDNKPAVVQTLSNLADTGITFTDADWTIMGKIERVLKPLEEATKLLSKHDASISMVIPFVTTLLEDLKDKPEDRGILTWKRALRDNIEMRFADIENIKDYTVATMLDSRYKYCLFRGADTFGETKDFIIEKLMECLQGTQQVCLTLSNSRI